MTNRKLDRQETDFMREYVQEGVDRGETAEQIRVRRRELTALLDCTLSQVSGAVAWKQKGGEKLVLEPLSLPQEAEPQQGITGPPLPSDNHQQQSVSEQPDPIQPGQVEEVFERPDHVHVHPKSGAWADYEHSGIKETWRMAESDFIDRHVDKDPAKRAKMRILCTPGIKCYLEVRHLLKLGFKPENVYAVEREQKAWGDFEKNARELGLRPIFGELNDVLPRINAPFDIALIDFVNPGSDQNMYTIEKLPLAERAIVVLNVMAKREQASFQEHIGRLHKSACARSPDDPTVAQLEIRKELDMVLREHEENPQPLNLNQFSHRMIAAGMRAYKELEGYMSTDNDMSWDERDTMLWYMQRYAGTVRPESWLMPSMMAKLNVAPEHFADSEAAQTFSKERLQWMAAGHAFKELMQIFQTSGVPMLAVVNDPRLQKLHMLGDLLNCTALGRRQIVAMEKYRYKSTIGKTPSPFFTSLAVTELPKAQYRRYQNLVFFAMKYVDASLQCSKGDPVPMDAAVSRDGRKPGLFGLTSLKVVSHDRTLTSINFEDVLTTLDHYLQKFLPQYPLSAWEDQKQIPWKHLEDMQPPALNS